jgi:hypothetical protein
MKSLQRDAVTAFEQQFLARSPHRNGTPLDARAPRRPVGQDCLEVPAAQPAPWTKRVARRVRHCA